MENENKLPSMFNLFEEPAAVYQPTYRETVDIQPTAKQTKSGQCMFQWESGEKSYMENEFVLHTTFHLEKKQKNLVAADKCSVINNIALTMWSNCVLKINDTVCLMYALVHVLQRNVAGC